MSPLITFLLWAYIIVVQLPLHVDGLSVGQPGTSSSSSFILETILATVDGSDRSVKDDIPDCKVVYTSDIQEQNACLSLKEYIEFTKSRNIDCIDLFDRYESRIVRCSNLSDSVHKELNVQWEASWVGAGSVWLFNLADQIGWNVEKSVPDPSRISEFSWKKVFRTFRDAFQTGTIRLPVFVVEGNTRIKLNGYIEGDPSSTITLVESIDLVREADLSRLQNRIVAQEFASWLDVSRRPLKMDGEEAEWAVIVRERILSGVSGAGPLDVDPNADDPGVTALVFSGILTASFGLLYMFLLDEITGGTAQVSELCEDAEKLEFGQGYLSECFGAFGDGPFL